MFQYGADCAIGAETSLHASPNNMTFSGGSCIMSKNNFVPTAISHWNKITKALTTIIIDYHVKEASSYMLHVN